MAADTIICAFSDHGELLDDHNDEAKSKTWQGISRFWTVTSNALTANSCA